MLRVHFVVSFYLDLLPPRSLILLPKSKRLYIYSKDEPHPALVAVEADYSVNEVIESFLDFLKLDDDPECAFLFIFGQYPHI